MIPALEARGITVEYDMPEGLVLLKDANLEKAIRGALGIPTELLKKEDLSILTELVIDGGHPDNPELTEGEKIQDLTGIQHCYQLQLLNLRNHQISNITPLASLTQLSKLDLSFNQVSDVRSIAKLTKLNWLNLVDNKIEDLSPLTSLINLTTLWLHNNHFSDLSSLSKLTNLISLGLASNKVTDKT